MHEIGKGKQTAAILSYKITLQKFNIEFIENNKLFTGSIPKIVPLKIVPFFKIMFNNSTTLK